LSKGAEIRIPENQSKYLFTLNNLTEGVENEKKMCDHPAGVLFAVIVALLFSFLNYYTMGNLQTTVIWAIAVVVIYFIFCLLCWAKEDSETENDQKKS
jgi:amino acid transporter